MYSEFPKRLSHWHANILRDLKSVELRNVSTMASPFHFVDESANTPFSDSWMELFQSESSDDDFDGFNEDDCQFGLKSNVREFHQRRDEER